MYIARISWKTSWIDDSRAITWLYIGHDEFNFSKILLILAMKKRVTFPQSHENFFKTQIIIFHKTISRIWNTDLKINVIHHSGGSLFLNYRTRKSNKIRHPSQDKALELLILCNFRDPISWKIIILQNNIPPPIVKLSFEQSKFLRFLLYLPVSSFCSYEPRKVIIRFDAWNWRLT